MSQHPTEHDRSRTDPQAACGCGATHVAEPTIDHEFGRRHGLRLKPASVHASTLDLFHHARHLNPRAIFKPKRAVAQVGWRQLARPASRRGRCARMISLGLLPGILFRGNKRLSPPCRSPAGAALENRGGRAATWRDGISEWCIVTRRSGCRRKLWTRELTR